MEHQIKQEPNDFEMAVDPPPAYPQMQLQEQLKSHGMIPGSSSTMNVDFFAEIAGIPFTMHLKPVNQYLEDAPLKTTKPPARNIAPQTFSSLPESVEQDPRDPTRVVGERSSTSHVSDLYEYIQGNCPKNSVKAFNFNEPHQQQFEVILELNGMEPIQPEYDRKGDDMEPTPRLFPSKKAAKEYVAKLALDLLKKRPPQPEHIIVGPGKLKAESPMGELNRYCSQNALPRPHVLDTSNSRPPYFFGCEITIDISGEKKFGDPNPNHPNKTAARNEAAQRALDWINKENPRIIKMKGKSGKSGRILAPGSLVQIDATGKTIGEVATEACSLLGFKAPQKKLVPAGQLTGMYNVFVTLEHGEQRADIGPIKNIYGQKNASKEAMKQTLLTVQYLAEAQYSVKLEIIGKIEFEL